MKNYVIFNLNDTKYHKFLICLTYESILNYLYEIEQDIDANQSCSTLLIDQLLVTGNGKNRFIACNYINGKLNLSTTKNVKPNLTIKNITVQFLKSNIEIINNSILSERQQKVLKRVVSLSNG